MSVSKQPTLGKITNEGPGVAYLRSELESLRVIGVEEHVSFPELIERIPEEGIANDIWRNGAA